MKVLRGREASRLLEKFGIDPRRYWLLMDLFDLISQRGEMMDQLGRNGVALKSAAIWYFIFSAVISVGVILSQPSVTTYLTIFLFLTAFMLGSILVSEAGNSLINPQEALILAHQPINGATYTAAKLSHLARIVLYLVPGVNTIPALAGLVLKGASWYYPILHLAAAFAVGFAAALLCCALFGWMVRFVPVKRLKAAGQFVGALPFMGMVWGPQAGRRLARLHPLTWLPTQPAVLWGLGGVTCAAMVAAVALGIRSLSADYLIRVSEMTRGGAAAGSRARRSRLGAIVGRLFGGQPALAGFAFVSRMMMRDWQFRRQLFPILIYPFFGLGSIFASGWPKDPFLRQFSPIHLLPHILGLLLFFICSALRYGNDYKGVWIFLAVPSRAFDGFAGGIFAVLWIYFILIPSLIVLPLLAWPWGIWHAGLFIAYTIAAASIYLALELRLIEEVPFGKQVDKPGGAALLMLMVGGICIAIAVSIQYLLVFRSAAVVAVTALALAVTAYFVMRASLIDLAVSIRYHLGLISAEAKPLYKEIAV
jgi:hypothetical protein